MNRTYSIYLRPYVIGLIFSIDDFDLFLSLRNLRYCRNMSSLFDDDSEFYCTVRL